MQLLYDLGVQPLDKDRNYQNIINKLSLKNQKNVANRGNFSQELIFPGNEALPGTIASRRNGPNISYEIEATGQFLDPKISKNIFEIITIPYPEFFLAQYEITFWTQDQFSESRKHWAPLPSVECTIYADKGTIMFEK
mgnify:CR=1 FL=1